MRSGIISILSGMAKYVGANGDFVSAGADSWDHLTYYLDLNNGEVNPSHGPYTRTNGFSLRCLQE